MRFELLARLSRRSRDSGCRVDVGILGSTVLRVISVHSLGFENSRVDVQVRV